MLPAIPSDDVMKLALGDAKFSGYSRSVMQTFAKAFTDLKNGLFGKLCHGVLLANNSIPESVPLSRSVRLIISLRTKPEMVRAHARRIVTGMADAKSFRNWPDAQKPGSSVGINIWVPTIRNAATDLSITKLISAGSPNPTPFSFPDLFPKALREGWRKTLRCQVLRGNLLHSYFSLPRLVTGQFGASSLSRSS